MPYDVLPDLAAMSLAEVARAIEERRLPPVTSWDPPEAIDSKMRIASNGIWFHEGQPIQRPAMVRAFSSLLMRDDDGRHWLMTPQCRQSIEVDDAAFIAVDVARKGDALAFRLSTDEVVLAGPDHPLRSAGDVDTPAIYLAVRHGCEARLDRSTWLQLVELADLAGDQLCVTSIGMSFSLTPL